MTLIMAFPLVENKGIVIASDTLWNNVRLGEITEKNSHRGDKIWIYNSTIKYSRREMITRIARL